MKYTLRNLRTEEESNHSTWGGVMKGIAKHAAKYPDLGVNEVIFIEKDREGEREYNAAGKMLRENGHYE